MTLSTILVHLDNSARCAARVGVAVALAGKHGSHLVGLVPTGMLDGVLPADAIPVGGTDFIAESAEYLRRRAESIVHAFRAQVLAAGGLSHEVNVVNGESVSAVVQHGRASDLVVVGQGGSADAFDIATRSLAQQVLMQVGRPLLVVPFAGQFAAIGSKVLVAWDDTREAAVALRDALPLLAGAARVTLVSCRKSPSALGDPDLHAKAMCRWLARHGIEAVSEEQVGSMGVSDMLLSRASDLGCDLIVMGGYGHARLRELVLGGVTRDMLAHMTVPVLLSR